MTQNNAWLAANEKKIEDLKQFLVQLDYRGSYADVPLMEINRILSGTVEEVRKLQRRIDELEENKT